MNQALALTGWKRGLFFLLLVYTLAHLAYSVICYNPITHPVIGSDVYVSYLEAAHWRETGEFVLMGNTDVAYPAFYYLLLRSLTVLPYHTISLFLYGFQFVLFFLAAALLVKAVSNGSPDPMAYGIAAILILNFQPFLETMSLHKVEGLEFFLICAIIAAFKKGRERWAGFLLFCATFLKYLPGILILYFLVKGKGKVLGYFAGACLIYFLFLWLSLEGKSAGALGFGHTLGLLGFSPLDTNQLVANFEWQSLSGTINRLLVQMDPRTLAQHLVRSQQIPLDQPLAAHQLALVLKGLLLGAYLWLIWRRRSSQEDQRTWPLVCIEISLTLVLLAVLPQAFRTHYGILLLPAFLMGGLLLYRYREIFRLPEKILFGAAYLLSGMVIPGGLLNRLPAHPELGSVYARWYLWWSLPFYGYAILTVCLLLCYKRWVDSLVYAK